MSKNDGSLEFVSKSRVPFKDIKAGCHYYENLCKNMLVFVCKI